jgi:ribosome-binding protein aMBF1 (putative translation factor)
VLLEPVTVGPPLPEGFVDIDDLVEEAEKDPASRPYLEAGRRDLAENYYAAEPRRLVYFRLRNGWSQKELASRLSTSQSYVARLEAGEIDPQLSTLKRLADVLDLEPAIILNAILAGARQS